jgi:transposase-like protein
VDKEGRTIEFMPGAKRDVFTAKRFFRKMVASRATPRRVRFIFDQQERRTLDLPTCTASRNV